MKIDNPPSVRLPLCIAVLSIAVSPPFVSASEPSSAPIERVTTKLDNATTFYVEVMGRLTGPAGSFDYTATVRIGDNGQARIDQRQRADMTLSFVSDGQRSAVLRNDDGLRFREVAQSRHYWNRLIAYDGLGKTLLSGELFELTKTKLADESDAHFSVDDLKSGPDDRSWTYQVKGPTSRENSRVAVWLNPKSGLPFKREVVIGSTDGELRNGGLTITEWYANWSLTENFSPTFFATPEPHDES